MKRISAKDFELSVVKFFDKKKEFEEQKKQFDKEKEEFYSLSEKYFDDNEIEKNVNFDFGEMNLILSKVKRVKLIFDVDKLAKKLSKKIFKEVIQKKIIINIARV